MNELERKLKDINDNISYYRNHSTNSNEEKEEAIRKLQQEKTEVESLIAFFDNANTRIEELESKGNLSKEERKELRELNKSIDSKRKEYNKNYQGKYRDVLSAYFGQIDKRIHNRIYKSNSLWRNKNSRVTARYANVGKYFIKNVGISLGVLLVPGFVSMFIPSIASVAIGAFGVYLGQTVIKTVAAIYNKVKYGGPRLTREYSIAKNSYFKNIEDCWGNILNNKTLSKSEVRSIKRELNVRSEGLREPVMEDLEVKRNDDKSETLSLANSMIYSCDIDKVSDSYLKEIVNLVENNDLFDRLRDKIRDKYLLIKSKLENKDEKDDTLINSINIRLENLDINKMMQEDIIKTIKFIDEHNLVDKLSDNAREKYNQLLEKVKVKEVTKEKPIDEAEEEIKEEPKEEPKKEKINDYDDKIMFNNIIKDFDYSKFTIYNYENLFKYASDNDLEKELSKDNKKKYQQLKVIYNAMIKIRDFDLEKFDVNIANEISDVIRKNKITKKLNNESYRKYQKIINKFNLENTQEKTNDSKKMASDSNKIMAMKGFIDVLQGLPRDITEYDTNQLLLVINYIKDNNLMEECRDYLARFEQEYNNRMEKNESIEDNIDPRAAQIARYYVKYPVKIRRTMPNKEIAILGKRIREGVATKEEHKAYLILCQREASRNYSSNSMEMDESIENDVKKAK